MHHTLATKMPVLSSQLHRPLDLTEIDATRSNSPDLADSQPEDENWSWPAAEARLKKAFDKGGYSGWAQAAIVEVEAEARSERLKRQRSRAELEHKS
jgi:hypothetical protein